LATYGSLSANLLSGVGLKPSEEEVLAMIKSVDEDQDEVSKSTCSLSI
jgi:hypothetical protein